MAKPKNAGEAINARLLSGEYVAAIVGTRVTPNKPTQGSEGVKPYLCHYRLTGGGASTLEDSCKLQRYLYRLEFYCETDGAAEELRKACLDRLCGNSRESIAPWVDKASGVHTCRPVDDADADTLDDGSQVAGQTVSIWFCPQPDED